MGVYIKVIPYEKDEFEKFTKFSNILNLLQADKVSENDLIYKLQDVRKFVEHYESYEEILVKGFDIFYGVGWSNLTVDLRPLFPNWKFCPEMKPWPPDEIKKDLIPKYELFTHHNLYPSLVGTILEFLQTLVKNNYILIPE